MVPAAALDAVPMKGIIFHWTAGLSFPSDLDKSHYHFLVDANGAMHRGVAIAKNSAVGLRIGYAAHTLNCNTGFIGVSLCGMAGAIEIPFNSGRYPLNENQLLTAIGIGRELCAFYKIPVTPKTVLTHAEVQTNLGIKQKGKWDIAVFPWVSHAFNTARKCGDFIRTEMEGK